MNYNENDPNFESLSLSNIEDTINKLNESIKWFEELLKYKNSSYKKNNLYFSQNRDILEDKFIIPLADILWTIENENILEKYSTKFRLTRRRWLGWS